MQDFTSVSISNRDFITQTEIKDSEIFPTD